jgi:hypothetical protein
MGTTVENQWHASRNITGHDPEDEKEKKRIGKIDKVRQTIKRSS